MVRLVILLFVCILLPTIYTSTIPVTTIQVPQLSYQEYVTLKTSMRKSESEMKQLNSIRKGLCGTLHQKHINQYYTSHPSAKQQQSQCSNIVTSCDNPTFRNQYSNISNTLLFELEFFIENNGKALANNAANRVAVILAETNQFYANSGIQFTSTIHLWGPLKDSNGNTISTWYTNDPCDDSMSQPCYNFVQIINSIVTGLPQNPRNNWPKDKAIQIFVAEIQTDNSGLSILGFAYFPFDPRSGLSVMLPSTVNSGDRTLPHELGHAFGLYHTHAGINEIRSCSDSCYEATASDVKGDLCADTPPYPNVVQVAYLFNPPTCRAPTTSEVPDQCSSTRSSWSQIGSANIMSYTSDACATQFTSCQNKRMRCVAETILYPRDASTHGGGEGGGVIGPNASSQWSIAISVVFVVFLFLMF